MDIHELPRRGYSSLTVHRDRGVLWVCDISNSSSFINSDDLAEYIEAFLPRLHWVSSLAIQAIQGVLRQALPPEPLPVSKPAPDTNPC